MNEDFVLKRVRQLREERNWSLYRLTQEADISYPTLRNTIIRNNVPTVPTIFRLCEGFGITMKEFFDVGGTVAAPLSVSDKRLLADWHRLPRSDKELLLAYMKGLLELEENRAAARLHTKEQAV